MKRTFKLFSVLLAVMMLVQVSVPAAYAAEQNDSNELVLLDVYSTDHYEMFAYQEGDMYYVITITGDEQKIELASAEKGHVARTICLDMQDVAPSSQAMMATNNVRGLNFAETVIEYGKQHQNQSKVVGVEVVHRDEQDALASANLMEVRGTGTDDYNSLIHQLEEIHGQEHYDYNWTGMASNTVGGLTFNYKQMLDYDMIYRDSFYFNVGTTLGGIVATILAFFPGMTVSMGIIAGVLGVASLTNTILERSGAIASYYGSAVYCRYVLVQGGGPYYQCYKVTDYNGWVEEGNYNSAKLEDLGTRYDPLEQIYNSYTMQRDRARENYE